MSGAQISINAKDLDRVQRLLDRLARADFAEVLDTIGASVESQVRRRISTEKQAPDGSAWPAWSDRYMRRGTGYALLKTREANLFGSITYNVMGRDSVEIGSPLIYAATHQFGDDDRNIPARPYLGLSSEDEDDIQDDIEAWLEEILQ